MQYGYRTGREEVEAKKFKSELRLTSLVWYGLVAWTTENDIHWNELLSWNCVQNNMTWEKELWFSPNYVLIYETVYIFKPVLINVSSTKTERSYQSEVNKLKKYIWEKMRDLISINICMTNPKPKIHFQKILFQSAGIKKNVTKKFTQENRVTTHVHRLANSLHKNQEVEEHANITQLTSHQTM